VNAFPSRGRLGYRLITDLPAKDQITIPKIARIELIRPMMKFRIAFNISMLLQ